VGPGVLRTVIVETTHDAGIDRSSRRSLIGRWERFWFADIPFETIALLRIAIGIVGLINLIGFTPVDMYWTPDGLAPVPGGGLGYRTYIIESGLGTFVGWAFFVALAVAFICVIVGFFANAAVLVAFLGSLMQVRWNPLPLTAGHAVLLSALFCLIWTDSGARLSLDDWWRRRARPSPAGPQHSSAPRSQSIWPLRLIRFQIALIYFTSGLFKLFGGLWREGSAVYYTTGQNIFGRIFHVYPVPPSLGWTLTALTYGTLLWELLFPLLLLHRVTRRLAVASGIAMHLGVLATMEVGPFTWMMLAAYVAFLDPKTTSRLVTIRT
jgi:hypothetical protein